MLAAATLLAAPGPPDAIADGDVRPPSIGFVLDAVGDWLLDDHATLAVGQAVPARGKLRPLAPGENTSLTLVFFDGSVRSYTCEIPGSCNDEIVLPETLPPLRSWGTRKDASSPP